MALSAHLVPEAPVKLFCVNTPQHLSSCGRIDCSNRHNTRTPGQRILSATHANAH